MRMDLGTAKLDQYIATVSLCLYGNAFYPPGLILRYEQPEELLI